MMLFYLDFPMNPMEIFWMIENHAQDTFFVAVMPPSAGVPRNKSLLLYLQLKSSIWPYPYQPDI
jgi:hypothetical protein